MKAKPMKKAGKKYLVCDPSEATHLNINFPGPTGEIILPVITSGPRHGTICWTWNGSLEAPTLRPSVLTRGHDFICHCWVTDGFVQFLGDSTHEFSGQTVEILNLEE